MKTKAHPVLRPTLYALLLLAAAATAPSAPAAPFDHSHPLLGKVLKTHVRNALVNYPALKAEPTGLHLYLDLTAAVTQAEFDQWTKPQQLAFLINLYNAGTLKLIIDHHPVESIKKIGSLFSGPWDQKVIRLFGKVTTLDAVEHDILRKNYQEPRIHFAIVCAAIGCPPLRDEAYTATQLDSQLDHQTRTFLGDPSKNFADTKTHTLNLSPIFKWFAEDFEAGSGSVTRFVTPYLPAQVQPALKEGRWRIKYTDYDWSLNTQ